MVSKASREEKTKATNSSDVYRLADLLGAMKINAESHHQIIKQYSNLDSHLHSLILLIVFSATLIAVCAEIRQQSSNPACLNLLYSSSLVKRRDCRGYDVDWTKDTLHVGGGIIPSPVSPVRQQGFKCGACWAVASVAAVESATGISSGPEVSLPPLSVQQILDCARGYGCRGGLETDAYCYIIKNRGLASEERYGYTEKNGICDKSRASQVVGGSIMAFALVSPRTETALEEALCRGPVTAGIAANSSDFVKYSGGIFHGACGAESDHAVLVVGYGKDDDGTKYWKIQNSWGNSWGEEGYMRMSYEAGEGCKITQNASFPLVNVIRDYEIT